MTLKYNSMPFGAELKGYSVTSDDGHVTKHYPEDRATDIGGYDSPQIFLDRRDVTAAYGDAHSLQTSNYRRDRAWPKNIRIQEHDLAVVMLRLTCMDVYRIYGECYEHNERVLNRGFREKAYTELCLTDTSRKSSVNIATASNVFMFTPVLLKDSEWDPSSTTIKAATSDDAQNILENDAGRVIFNWSQEKNFAQYTHEAMLCMEEVSPGYMARNSHLYLGAIFANAEGKATKLPLTRPQMPPPVTIISNSMRKMGL